MTTTTFARAATAATLAALFASSGCRDAEEPRGIAAVASQPDVHPAFLYGEVTLTNGETVRGRLRFGREEEAFWGDYFNGVRKRNPWVADVPEGALPTERLSLLGLKIGPRRAVNVKRPFMVRFGDIAVLEADGSDLMVTMRSGTVHHLDRYAYDDFADGVRVWDESGQVHDLGERRVRRIEFMHSEVAGSQAPYRLHGSVTSQQGEFVGFIQWGRSGSVALDELTGQTVAGDRVSLPYATIRSIARQDRESLLVTLLDGRVFVLSGTGHLGAENRGLYVDDARYGRVLISWDAFQRVDFTPAGTEGARGGPAYGEFAAGAKLNGTVVTRDGRRHSGRVVFDLDESETTETLDAPVGGVHYTIPFALVQSLVLPADAAGARAQVRLHNGENLVLERADDLGPDNAGVLIFAGDGKPQYVAWRDIARLDLGAAAAAQR